MEAKDHIRNGANDVLTPVKINEAGALYQVVGGQDCTKKDIFFIAELESKKDDYGTKLHIAGGDEWESKGKYIKGKDSAMELFSTLSPENQEKAKADDYYKV